MSEAPSENFLLRCWHWLWRPSLSWPWVVLIAVGLLLGVAFSGIFAGALYYTSSDAFCSSCHAQNAVPEWKNSLHVKNRAGITIGCADCHEPHDPVGMMLRKMAAVNEVWHQFLGTIDTPEKFEAHRLEMAEREWNRLRADNSRECQNCHQVSQMTDPQRAFLGPMHRTALANGQNCVDCHKGVAHHPPVVTGQN